VFVFVQDHFSIIWSSPYCTELFSRKSTLIAQFSWLVMVWFCRTFQQLDDCYSEVVDKMSIGTPSLQKRRETLAVRCSIMNCYLCCNVYVVIFFSVCLTWSLLHIASYKLFADMCAKNTEFFKGLNETSFMLLSLLFWPCGYILYYYCIVMQTFVMRAVLLSNWIFMH